MLPRIAPIIALGLLSGCTLVNGDQYQKTTLSALEQSEARLSNQITNLALQSSNQSDYIESLETEILALQQQLAHLTPEPAEETEQTPPTPLPEVAKPEPKNYAAPTVVTHSKHRHAQTVLGAIERISIEAIEQSFNARVDTGAATSSLNAIDIAIFERNGDDWVRFHMVDDQKSKAEQKWLEAPVVRYVKIRQSTTSKLERRAVVELWIKLGDIHEKAQFTLADRSQMSHPVLLGREFIRDIALVDVSQEYLQSNAK